MKMGTDGLIEWIVTLVVVGYAGWSATRKQARKRNQSGQPGKGWNDENFPFPKADTQKPSSEMELRECQLHDQQEKSLEMVILEEEDLQSPVLEVEEEEEVNNVDMQKEHCGTPTAFNSQQMSAAVGSGPMMEQQQEQQRLESLTPDLRTMIIASELLKPKFEEY